LVTAWLLTGAIAITGSAAAQDVGVDVDTPTTVQPDDTFTVTITSDRATELEISGDTENFTVEQVPEAEGDLTTFPSPGELPTKLKPDDLVATSQLESPSAMTFEVVFNSTVEEGTYDFTATAEAEEDDGSTAETTEDFSLTVESIDPDTGPTVQAPETVQPNETFTLNISAEDAFELRVEGDIDGFTVEEYQENSGGNLGTFPAPSDLPVELTTGDDFLTTDVSSEEPTSQEFVVNMNATVEEGTYEFTAVADDDVEAIEQDFTINVTDQPVPADNPVSDEVYTSVDTGADGQLDRNEIREGVRQFAISGEINSIGVSRSEIRQLIQYFATQGR
jgi:hypothetical protein